jgi:hypothetical protein
MWSVGVVYCFDMFNISINMMNASKKKDYFAPNVTTVAFLVERGFDATGGTTETDEFNSNSENDVLEDYQANNANTYFGI